MRRRSRGFSTTPRFNTSIPIARAMPRGNVIALNATIPISSAAASGPPRNLCAARAAPRARTSSGAHSRRCPPPDSQPPTRSVDRCAIRLDHMRELVDHHAEVVGVFGDPLRAELRAIARGERGRLAVVQLGAEHDDDLSRPSPSVGGEKAAADREPRGADLAGVVGPPLGRWRAGATKRARSP